MDSRERQILTEKILNQRRHDFKELIYHKHNIESDSVSMLGPFNQMSVAPTISLASYQNIGLHPGARGNVVLLTYLLGNTELKSSRSD